MKSQNFVLLKFYGKKSMSREKWLSTIEIAIPEVPSEVKVKIPESVFALFNPRINGKTVILGYDPVEPYSPIVERKIFFRSTHQKAPNNSEHQPDAQKTRYNSPVRIYLEKTKAVLNFR